MDSLALDREEIGATKSINPRYFVLGVERRPGALIYTILLLCLIEYFIHSLKQFYLFSSVYEKLNIH